jgi:putative tryptophan/tyrosine transport system substrate-binding protein
MNRRDLITLLGGAAMLPVAARAQQAVPVVGFINAGFPRGFAGALGGFHRGLNESGFVEGRNVNIEYRWAEGQFDRLPTLAADLVRHRVAAVFAGQPATVRAIKAATTTIPIVFSMGEDPVKEGIVPSFNRPGGNVTGISYFTNQLVGKRLALLTETVPTAAMVALLVNRNNPNAEPDTEDAQAAAAALGRRLEVLTASTERDVAAAFITMSQRQIGASSVGVDGFFVDQRELLITLAASHGIPAIYDRREYSASGGLMSYGASQVEAWGHAGIYVGRILKGEKPADLPVQQSTKFDFVINLRTAKALGLAVPPTLLALADEVIE